MEGRKDCCLGNGRRTGRRRIEKINLGKSTKNPNQRQDGDQSVMDRLVMDY